jgi:hypothetical protein
MKQLNKSTRFLPAFGLLAALVVGLFAVAVRPSQAAVGDLVFTIEAPGVQQSQVSCPSGLGLETFDSVTLGGYLQLTGALGGYSAAFDGASLFVQDQSKFGGAEVPASQTPSYVTTSFSYELTLDDPAGYFGFWWSAGDGSNKVTVKMADGSSQVFTTQSILDSGSLLGSPGAGLDGHYGNPTQAFLGEVDTEVFTFVNIFATNPNAKITSLLFEQVQGSIGQFESDNHTACADILDPNTGSPVPQIGSITIVKEANPQSEQLFSFLTSIGGPNQGFQLKDNGTDPNSITFNDLPPSSYNVFEQVPTGWTLDPVQCSGGADIITSGANVQITLSGGEDVTCTFTNRRTTVNLTIAKEATGGDGTFEFEKGVNSVVDFADFSLTTQGGTAQKTLADLPADFIEIIEVENPAWELTDVQCEGVTNGAWIIDQFDRLRITPTAGDDVVCTFTNEKDLGSITIVKEAFPADDTEFTFREDISNPPSLTEFKLKDPSDTTKLFANLPAGNYSVQEIVPSGWDDEPGIKCDKGDDLTSIGFNFGDAKVFIGLAPGDDVVCTFTNELKLGTINIVKQTAPADGVGFGFKDDIEQPNSFTLDDGQTKTFLDVVPGQYTVTEDDPGPGVFLSGLVCDDANSATPSTVDLGAREATINVEPGETVTCTYTNTAEDYIVIAKLTDPAGGTGFDFTSSLGNFSLDDGEIEIFELQTTGTFTFTEEDPGADYALSFLECAILKPGQDPIFVAGDLVNRSVDVMLDAPGQAAFCLFVNSLINACPVDPNVGNELTDLMGRGMGGPTKAFKQAKYIFSDADEMVALYGQLAAVDVGIMKYVRFFDGTTTQINPPTSPAYRSWAVDWWGMELNPNRVIKGQFFTGKGAAKAPRGLVLWPTYGTGDALYANVLTTFDESIENHVYWDTGWVPMQTQLIDIPETQTAGADITVKVALVDNQPDSRPVVMTVTPLPGGTPVELVLFGPNVPGKPKGWQNTLNLETIVLENVPAGVNQVEIKLLSPDPFDTTYGTGSQGGDSAAMIGAAANYACALPSQSNP